MSEAGARRIRLVAVGAALVAMVFTLVAVIVVLARDGGHDDSRSSADHLTTHDVKATDVVRLRHDDVELVVEKGTTKGVRVKDAALAKSLGLEPGDVIMAMSGKPLTREMDSYDVITKLSLMNATTLYIEVSRKDKPLLLRWRLDGDLRQARYSATTSQSLFGSYPPPSYTPPSTPPSYAPPSYATPDDDDAIAKLVDTIEKIDDSHYRIPRKTIDALLANPMDVAKGARVVPSIRNGQADGIKLYAIRPSSIYAKLGLSNGDTINSINGFELTSPDKALEVYTKLRDATQLDFEITRRGQPFELFYEITK